MSRNLLASAELDGQMVEKIICGRARVLGVIGGVTIATIIIAVAVFISGFMVLHPYNAFGMAFFLFMVAAGLSMWSYGEYRSLIVIDKRRREAEQG